MILRAVFGRPVGGFGKLSGGREYHVKSWMKGIFGYVIAFCGVIGQERSREVINECKLTSFILVRFKITENMKLSHGLFEHLYFLLFHDFQNIM